MEGSQICNSSSNDVDIAASDSSRLVAKRRRSQLLGYLFALISSLTGVAMSSFAVIYTDKKIDVVIARCIFQFLCTWPIINYKKVDVFGTSLNTTLLLLLRGFLSATAVTTVHMSFQYLSIGDVTALFYAYPGLVGILARIWLKGKNYNGILRPNCLNYNCILAGSKPALFGMRGKINCGG